MFFERVFSDVEMQFAVEVFEEDFAEMVAFGDDDGVFVRQIAQRGECWSEHRVRAYEWVVAIGIEFGQAGLDGCDVGKDALFSDVGHHHSECVECKLDGSSVDDEFGVEGAYFFGVGHSLGVEGEAKPLRVGIEDAYGVLEAEQVGEECPHLACAYNKYSHRC